MRKDMQASGSLIVLLVSLTMTVIAFAIPVATHAAAPAISGCPIFPADNVWNTPIDTMQVDTNSSAYISTIGANTGVHPDFGSGLWDGGPIGIPYNVVPGTQPKVAIGFDYADESDPGPYPIPPNPLIEGGSQSTGDRHVLVIDSDNALLYETWSTYPKSGGTWHAGSGAVFNLRSNALRPAQWTSSDAAGLPVLAGLLRYDDVASGEVTHAVRFTAPQTRQAYIWPARHYASSLTAVKYPPMGQRFRLKASFDISTFSAQTQVILRGLKKYGMILADNGSSWFISGAPDSRWNNDVLVGELSRVKGSDFEAIDESPLIVSPDSAQACSNGTTNLPPNADAGPDQSVDAGALVTLNGSNSTDTDDGIASYRWTQISGTRVVLSNSSAASTTFKAPEVGTSGEALTFSLTVTDRGGLQSTDTCIVNVAWANAPPTANAGPDQTVPEGSVVTLNGSGSTDPDDGIASYSWKQTGGISVALQGSGTDHPSFTAPDVGQGGRTLTFELTVTDVGGLKSADSCIVNVGWVDAPPVANAGSNQNVYVGQTVKLDGSGSTDPDDGIASYLWTQTSGPPVKLSGAKAIAPTFKAPAMTQDGTALGFLLTVKDRSGLSSTARCAIYVYKKHPDLTGSWTAFGYTNPKLTGTLQVRNAGNGNAGQFTTSFYLSADGVSPGQLIGKHTVTSLKAGARLNVGFSHSQAGLSKQYIVAVIDSGRQVAESLESNNAISRVIP